MESRESGRPRDGRTAGHYETATTSVRKPDTSVADRLAVFAHLGCAPIGPVLPIPQNSLIPAKSARPRNQMMSTFGEFGADRRRNSGFHLHKTHTAGFLPGNLRAPDMPKTHEVARLLNIHAEVDHVNQHLHMALRLHVSAHQSKRKPGLSILHHKTRDDSVEGSFSRRIHIRRMRIERKQGAAIMEHKTKAVRNQT